MNYHERLRTLLSECVSDGLTLEQIMGEVEAQTIEIALEQTGWNIKQTAAKLCVHRNTLNNKLRDHAFPYVQNRGGLRSARGGRS